MQLFFFKCLCVKKTEICHSNVARINNGDYFCRIKYLIISKIIQYGGEFCKYDNTDQVFEVSLLDYLLRNC